MRRSLFQIHVTPAYTSSHTLGGSLEFVREDGTSVDVPLPTMDLLPMPDSVKNYTLDEPKYD